MKKLILSFIAFVLILSLIQSAEAQNPLSAFVQNLQSGAISNSIANFGKDTVFLWYTTVGGELNPVYENQRRVLDSLLFFIIFFVIVRYAIKKVWPDLEKGPKEMLSLGVGIVLTISFVATRISIGFLLPYMKNIAFFGIALLIAFIINKFTNKENKPGGWITSIFIALAVSWLLMNAFNFFESKPISAIGGIFNSEKQTDIRARIIAGGDSVVTADPKINYELALGAVQKFDYETAKTHFEKVIVAGPANNPYFDKTAQWITIKGGDKLYRHMARHYPKIIAAEREAAEILIDKAEKLTAKDDKTQAKRNELLLQAKKYADDVIDKQTLLEIEIKKREAEIRKREAERQGAPQ